MDLSEEDRGTARVLTQSGYTPVGMFTANDAEILNNNKAVGREFGRHKI